MQRHAGGCQAWFSNAGGEQSRIFEGLSSSAGCLETGRIMCTRVTDRGKAAIEIQANADLETPRSLSRLARDRIIHGKHAGG
mmetsp:Transcript_78832/g.211667  ORF Transcript_78832/g.211667 Transcript_78832/m.211667 type:complete len:82 (-) Transcript_78832:364-609(-)